MKVNSQVYVSNFVREKEKENHGYVILLGSIKWSNNFVLKTSLITCWTQTKTQILTQKKTILKHMSIYRTIYTIRFYDSYDMHHYIIKFISTNNTKPFIHNMIRIAYCMILTTMIRASTITIRNLQLLELMHISN